MITNTSNKNKRELPKIHAKLEPAVREINVRIAAECKVMEISDILCQKFEQQIAIKISAREVRDLSLTADFIRNEGEEFILAHKGFLESRNPCDALSLLENPGTHRLAKRQSEAFRPTLYTPGSAGKIAVLSERALAGLPLWHPEDATYDTERNTALMHLLDEGSQSDSNT